MNTTDKILDILEYIDGHPDKDAMLSDMRMTDTNEFQKLLSAARSAELIDLANDPHTWYRDDGLADAGYIHADDRLDIAIEEIIEHVNKRERDFIVIERELLSKLVKRETAIHDACHGYTLNKQERDLLQALQGDGEI